MSSKMFSGNEDVFERKPGANLYKNNLDVDDGPVILYEIGPNDPQPALGDTITIGLRSHEAPKKIGYVKNGKLNYSKAVVQARMGVVCADGTVVLVPPGGSATFVREYGGLMPA